MVILKANSASFLPSGRCWRGSSRRSASPPGWTAQTGVGVDVKVILAPPCIFCIENH